MDRDFLQIFLLKLKLHRIQHKVLALEAGRNASYLSEVFNGKQSPTLETFKGLVQAADRLCPGFADEYYLALAGRVDMDSFVSSLSSNELAVLLMNVSQRVRKLGARENAIANTLQVLPPESVKELIEPLTEVLRAIGIAVGKVQ